MCHIKSLQFNKTLLMGKCFHALPTQKGRLKGVTVKTSVLVSAGNHDNIKVGIFILVCPLCDATKGKF